MSRKQILLTLILSLGSSGAPQANPLDSPGVVYIDGLPCNRACQSYMACVRSGSHPFGIAGERETTVVVAPDEIEQRFEHAARPRVAGGSPHRWSVLRRAPASRHRITDKASNARKAVAANPAYRPARKNVPAATATVIEEKTVARVTGVRSQGWRAPDRAGAGADSRRRHVAAARRSSHIQGAHAFEAEVALPPPAMLDIAAAPAAPAPGTALRTSAAAVSPDDQDNLVALVLTRPEINSAVRPE